MKFKNGDKARVKRTNKETMYKDIEGTTVLILDNFCGDLYRVFDCIGGQWILDEEMLEPADSKTLRMADGTIIGEFNTGGVLPTSDWYKLVFKNGSSIEVIPQKDDTVRSENHFCTGFRGGKIPTPKKPVSIEEQMKYYSDNLKALVEPIANATGVSYETVVDAFYNLGCTTFRLSPSEVSELIKKTEEKKMPTKFTFSVTEGTRVDKSCNGTIPTMTTTVETNGYSRTAPVGTATCDKADYDMRQGVLEALANMYCDGDFDKVFNKAVKRNELADKKKRTCKYCGKVFDTVEEREAEEAWHVERKKARRERYLLRKRAKEIAFEEQAQKMAKKMIEEDK